MTRVRRLAVSTLLATAFIFLGVLLVNLGSLVRTGRVRGPVSVLRLASTGRVHSDGTPVDSARVIHALEAVLDPEVDLNIVDLGLIRRISVDTLGNIAVEMLLTTPECPYAQGISSNAVNVLELIPGAGRVDLQIDKDRRWDPSLLGGTARERYLRVFRGDSSPHR